MIPFLSLWNYFGGDSATQVCPGDIFDAAGLMPNELVYDAASLEPDPIVYDAAALEPNPMVYDAARLEACND